MKEIRICWQPSVVHDDDDRKVSTRCNEWCLLTPRVEREMQLLCDAANKVYGVGSHWIETRNLPGIPDIG
jgi:hypothetical protein